MKLLTVCVSLFLLTFLLVPEAMIAPFQIGIIAVAADETGSDPVAEEAEPPSHRTLAVYYSRREFYGGPPIIPHEVDPQDSNSNCLDCHEEGEYYDEYQAFIPPTPHPQFRNCNACHVVDQSPRDTSEAMLKRIAPPTLHQVAVEGAPPVIPHTLQLRENCLSCHGSPAAPVEIRTTHPQRVHCQSCHVQISGKGDLQKK